jgi:hypothetical protein
LGVAVGAGVAVPTTRGCGVLMLHAMVMTVMIVTAVRIERLLSLENMKASKSANRRKPFYRQK